MTKETLRVDSRGLLIRKDPLPAPEGPWSTADILDYGVSAHPEKIALQHQEVVISWLELESRVSSIAGWLLSQGCCTGCRVVVQLSNSTIPVEIFLATQRLGAIWVGANSNLSKDETEWILQDCGASLFITEQNYVSKSCKTIGIKTNEADWIDLFNFSDEEPKREADPHSPAAIAYTSGTTGRPKGAVHSQHNLLWPGVSSRSLYPPTENERTGTALSLTVLNILVIGPLFSLIRGTTSVILDPSPAVGMAEQIRNAEVNNLLLVPTQAYDLVHSVAVKSEDLSSLDRVVIGASHTPQELRDQWQKKFGFPCTVGYGLSEAPSGVTRSRHERKGVLNGAGHALDPVEIGIFDEDGKEVPTGKVGEICISPRKEGPWQEVWSPMLGYWGKPEETMKALKGNMLHTGDIGSRDEDGHLTIVGRLSDLVVRGGANIYPAEVERVLLSFSSITEAAVIGVLDERLGERVCAAVVVQEDLDIPELSAQLNSQLAHYKVPEEIKTVTSLPRNVMGKVDREKLKHLFL
tara:strand:+ start:2949 stop:4514 length:1566 start_codon:yes stop_codon:yes gene_type:complete